MNFENLDTFLESLYNASSPNLDYSCHDFFIGMKIGFMHPHLEPPVGTNSEEGYIVGKELNRRLK